MAGKNDCGMAGKGWRETGGGKELARTYGGKGLCGIRHSFTKKNQGSFGKKMVACTSRPTTGQLVLVGPLQAYRPTAGRLDPVGQLEADWA